MVKERLANLIVEEMPIASLRPDPLNPRRIAEGQLEALTRSIQKYGFVQPVLIRGEDRLVIAGHQRLVAARRLGYEAVPCVVLDISTEEARTLNLAMNKIGGEFDLESLPRLLAELKTTDSDLSFTGFSEKELAWLLDNLDAREKRERIETFDYDAAMRAALGSPRVSAGQVWQLGQHRLMCGDATKPEDVTKLMAGSKGAMAFTDPPYNVAIGDHGGQQEGQRKRRLKNDALSPEAWEAFVRGWSRNLLSHVEGAFYICMSCKEWPLVSRVLEEEGGHWSDTIIWAKDRFVLGRADYQRQYEPMWYGWREGAPHQWHSGRDQGDVWRIERPSDSQLHPTMKPLALIERAIENSSSPGDVVVDLFLGSGSTLVSAERTGRTCFGLELDPVYVSIALARWEAFMGRKGEVAA